LHVAHVGVARPHEEYAGTVDGCAFQRIARRAKGRETGVALGRHSPNLHFAELACNVEFRFTVEKAGLHRHDQFQPAGRQFAIFAWEQPPIDLRPPVMFAILLVRSDQIGAAHIIVGK
jgi:hypothetical protein